MGVFFIGICGGSGSGKTTLAEGLRKELGEQRAVVLSQDSYYCDQSHLDQGARDVLNFDHPESVDFELLVEHLKRFEDKQSVMVPMYDFATHTRSGATIQFQAEVVILEGHLIFHHHLVRNKLHLKVFLENDMDILFIRRILRDIKERGRTFEQITDQYLEYVRPMYLQYVLPSKQWADLAIRSEGALTGNIAEIVHRIHGKLR